MGETGSRCASAEGAIRPETLRQKDHQVQSALESGSKWLPAHGEKALVAQISQASGQRGCDASASYCPDPEKDA